MRLSKDQRFHSSRVGDGAHGHWVDRRWNERGLIVLVVGSSGRGRLRVALICTCKIRPWGYEIRTEQNRYCIRLENVDPGGRNNKPQGYGDPPQGCQLYKTK